MDNQSDGRQSVRSRDNNVPLSRAVKVSAGSGNKKTPKKAVPGAASASNKDSGNKTRTLSRVSTDESHSTREEDFLKTTYSRMQSYQHKKERKIQRLKEEVLNKELEPLGVKVRSNNNYTGTRGGHRTLVQRAQDIIRAREEKLDEIRREKQDIRVKDEIKECTFQPQIIKKRVNFESYNSNQIKDFSSWVHRQRAVDQGKKNWTSGSDKQPYLNSLESMEFRPTLNQRSQRISVSS